MEAHNGCKNSGDRECEREREKFMRSANRQNKKAS